MKRENEAVVNRFLLSTLYIIIGEFLLFFMYKGSLSIRMAINMPGILVGLGAIALVGIAVCLALLAKGNRHALYYLAISIAVLVFKILLCNKHPCTFERIYVYRKKIWNCSNFCFLILCLRNCLLFYECKQSAEIISYVLKQGLPISANLIF